MTDITDTRKLLEKMIPKGVQKDEDGAYYTNDVIWSLIKQLIAEECNKARIQGAAYIYDIVFNSPKDSIYGEVSDGIEKLKREISTPNPIKSKKE